MNYHIDDNGWTVIVDDLDLRIATQEDIHNICKLLTTNTLVVLKNQHLTVNEELRIANMFKDPEILFKEENSEYHRIIVPNSEGKIIRVTGELNDHGEPGFFGHVHELRWHCNCPQFPDRKPIIWLRSVRGSKGSKTSWNNNILSYRNLDQEIKNVLINLETYLGFDPNRYAPPDVAPEPAYINKEYTPKIVHTNIAGIEGLFFPFLQMFGFKGMSEEESIRIMEPLIEYTTQEKFCYHHYWDDGDIVIADQWFGIHKRWEFDKMSTRLLHRIAMDYTDQDYKNCNI